MNLIEQLKGQVEENLPLASCELSAPLKSSGTWILDIRHGDRFLAVDWTEGRGFGITEVAGAGYGEGPDETADSHDTAFDRIRRLLLSGQKASPPLKILLTRLREERGLTQNQLAARLGVRQATVSGIERRGDVQLSTLNRVVEALGGRMEVVGLFPEGEYVLASSERSDFERLTRSEGPTVKLAARFEVLEQEGTLGAAGALAKKIKASGLLPMVA